MKDAYLLVYKEDGYGKHFFSTWSKVSFQADCLVRRGHKIISITHLGKIKTP